VQKELPESASGPLRLEGFRGERGMICAADILLPELLVHKGSASL
jgi:hypothetical protein